MSSIIGRDEDTHTHITTGNYDPNGASFDKMINYASLRGEHFYYNRLDVCYCNWDTAGVYPSASEAVCRFDPLWIDNSGSLFEATSEPGTIDGLACNDFALGYWDRTLSEQKIYAFNRVASGAAKPFHSVSPLALNVVLEQDAFPNVGANIPNNGLTSTDPYYYLAGGNWLIFEAYGRGYVYCPQWRDASGTLLQNVLVSVDLSTGNGYIEPIPMYYGAAIVHEYTEGPLWNQTVVFTEMQFVPDEDDTPTAPKGIMYMWSNHDEDPNNSLEWRIWYRLVDWNPTGKSGTPKRVHLRERLVSAVNVVKSNGAVTNGVYEGGLGGGSIYNWYYHPGSNQMFFFSGNVGLSSDPGEQKILWMTPSASFDHITNPYPLERVSSGKSVAWAVEALGDLQEPIAGVRVDWELENESTVREVLAVTPTPGETVTLANTVNPTDADISPIKVERDAVTLTESTHYNLLRGTSQIQFIAPEPQGGFTYYATYRHWEDPQTSPHGTLLNAVSSSDADGKAYARVRYDEEDPALDRWERISATDS